MPRQISLEVRQQLFRARVDARFKKIMSSLTSKLGVESMCKIFRYIVLLGLNLTHRQINIKICVLFEYTHFIVSTPKRRKHVKLAGATSFNHNVAIAMS